MKTKLISVLASERAKDVIASKSKAIHISLTALHQYNETDYTIALERCDDLLDFILEMMNESNESEN